ncbi:SRPBCC family protein [Sphingomonas psychrotolerans]|uniref:ATPase n=1 Tax=Sphingomonas psychrotolerans TaxID=1327635 RepID=A0A2K8MH01_9SPHN|nr:SRPBCC family protein [Sphingomonas psychrotolerans]ATY33160.1 ATPase [Sphingomonas psychrotolerans]
MVDTITAETLRFERELAAPVETVWQYLVDPEQRARWFMGGPTDLREGGAIGMTMRHGNLADAPDPMPKRYAPYDGKAWHETITRLDPPNLIAFTWSGGEAGEVTIELAPIGDARTRLTLTHTGLRGPDDARNFGGGWGAHLAVLERRLEGKHIASFWALHAEAEAAAAKALGA